MRRSVWKIRCVQHVSWRWKLANSRWIWGKWIYNVAWAHFCVLMICQICRMSQITWRERDVTPELRRLLGRPPHLTAYHSILALNKKAYRGHIGIPEYRSFFDVLQITLFRFDVWMNRYGADIIVDTQVIQIFPLGLLTEHLAAVELDSDHKIFGNSDSYGPKETSHHCLLIGWPAIRKMLTFEFITRLSKIFLATHLTLIAVRGYANNYAEKGLARNNHYVRFHDCSGYSVQENVNVWICHCWTHGRTFVRSFGQTTYIIGLLHCLTRKPKWWSSFLIKEKQSTDPPVT